MSTLQRVVSPSLVSSLHPLVKLDINNVAYVLVEHNFPPSKWKQLAVGLKQIKAIPTIKADKADALSSLVALITHWLANDLDKTWKKLVDAVAISEEKVIAMKLAGEVGV